MNDSTPSVEASFQGFTFFTNYAHVLFLIAKTSDVRMRELASEIGITERAVQRIVDDLTNSGYVSVTKEGRRNRYSVKADLSLKHPLAQHRSVGEFFQFIHSEPCNSAP